MESSKVREEVMPILLVEDEEAHALLVKRIFEEDEAGWNVDHVVYLKEARKWIEDHSEQDFLVVSDYRLPDGTGLDLIDGVKRPDEMKFPFILMTGVGSEKLAVKSLKSGAMDYVVKGDDLYQLPQAAKQVIIEWNKITERRQAERDLMEYINNLERSSSNPDEFADKIAQYLETSLTLDHESNEQLIENFRKKMARQGQDPATGAKAVRPGTSNALDLLSKEGLNGAMMIVDLELGRNPDSWEAWSAKADILYLQEKFFDSLKTLNKALELNPENSLAWNTKGNVLYRLDRYDQAIECYNKAIEISPLFPKSWYNKKLALELQLKRASKHIRVRSNSEDKDKGNGLGDKRSGKDSRSDDDKGDGTLRATIGRIR